MKFCSIRIIKNYNLKIYIFLNVFEILLLDI
jgi:hypothetical protein